ncbi:MAG: archaetidylserine synthase [Methanosarcina sp.]
MNVFEMLRPPDFVSLLNLICGISSILAAHDGSLDLALILLLLAAVADGADGYIARRFKGGELGEQLDSLADAVSFGVAPALFISLEYGKENDLLIIFPFFYALCGVLRLARFNSVTSRKSGFEGLPITAACVMLVTYLLMGEAFFSIDFLLALTLVLSLLMVSTVNYPKIRNTKTLAFIAFLFGMTMLFYFIDVTYNVQYTQVFSILPFFLMLIYLLFPFLKTSLPDSLNAKEYKDKGLKVGGRKEKN